MKQNKGFTLIELLAVIVILAIIALIATPIVLNMINEARRSAAKSSALGYVDSIEYYAGFSQAQSTDMQLGYDTAVPTVDTTTDSSATTLTCTATYANGATTWADTANVSSSGTSCATFMAAVDGKSKGKGPDSAVIILDGSGKVQANSTLTYGRFTCTYDGTDCSMN